MSDDDIPAELVRDTRAAWSRFVERTAPVRPELFRYCRALTGSVWDAEDLVQDTLLRAFARLSDLHTTVASVRGYLFRTASNLWIDRWRQAAPMVELADDGLGDESAPPSDVRGAARDLFLKLPPAERAAVLLKDVFDFSLEETAAALGSGVGAVKSALYRARAKLTDGSAREAPSPAARVSEALVRRFVDAFNAGDIAALTRLVREDAVSEMVGLFREEGGAAIGGPNGVLAHTLAGGAGRRTEAARHEGDWLVLFWEGEGAERRVFSLGRLEGEAGALTRLRYYFFCPEAMAAAGEDLDVPASNNGYLPSW
jgi:RNA polymerase sigma-70 factor (ECF subfamily)